MTGSGGIGTLPSSRLTRILQEKAEMLKKRRQTAEQFLRTAEERVKLLEQIQIRLPETKERDAQLKELSRRADWEAVETQAKAYLDYIGKAAQSAVEERRKEIADRGDRLVQAGTPLPPEVRTLLTELGQPPSEDQWGETIEKLAKFDLAIRTAETDFIASLRVRASAVAQWSGVDAERLAAVDVRFRAALEPVHQGRIGEAVQLLNAAVESELKEAVERRRAARDAGTALVAAAKDLTVPFSGLETALRHDADAYAIDWVETTPAVEAANAQLADSLRERVGAAIEALRSTLASLPEHGIDPTASLAVIEETLSQVPGASPAELPGLLTRARQATEEPVVGIVAGLLDEVRPRLVEVRRLGRDPSEVFAAMNRAREALRLKIYSEALAASQEAIDRVSQLTDDLDRAREEAVSLGVLLDRLASANFPVSPYRDALARATAALDRVDFEAARALLQETFQSLGHEAVTYFTSEFLSLDKVAAQAKERGFLTPSEEEDLPRVKRCLDEGRFGDASELLASLVVRLRTSAGPYIARRVEEISKGFEELPEESLVAPVRRLLADADVNLRVKEDLPNSLESLKRAEREFSAVFAAHASSLVEGLEDERRSLEAMGGAGDEIQRQIDEVQQIFNMGDFVKASRASQDIRTRAHQQQLVRSEEAVSHAKLALVELGKMGLDTVELRSALESAQEAARQQRFPESYQSATAALESALKLKAAAQSVLDALGEATEFWQQLRRTGLPVDPLRERITRAQQQYQGLDFDAARATLIELTQQLEYDRDGANARSQIAEVDLLIQDGHRIGLPVDTFLPRLAEAKAQASGGHHAEALEQIGPTRSDLILHLRPVLEENLRALERDVEVARGAGVEATDALQSLGEARRRLGLPVPTGVAELVEQARSQLIETRGLIEHAQRVTKRAREALNEAELVRVDVANARGRLDRVEQHLAGREFTRVIELASPLERELHQATYQQVSKTLASFHGTIVHARKGGTETTLAENLLNQARAALEDGHPFEALQLATRSETELERVELQRRIAQSSLETVEVKMGTAAGAGIKAPIAQAEVERARESLQRKEFPAVLEHAIAASDALGISREGHRRAREALDSSERQVKEAMEVGADVGEAVPALDAARAHAEAGEYPEAQRRAREAAEKSRWGIERLYAGAVGDARLLLDTAKIAGVTAELASIETPLDDAEMALKAREWSRANQLLAQSREAAQSALDALVAARWSAVERLYHDEGIVPAHEVGFRTQSMARVEAERANHSYAAAFKVIEEEQQRATDRWRQALQRSVGDLKERVWVGERLGLDTTPVMELFSEANLALESGKLGPVSGLVARADRELAGQVGERLPQKLRDMQTELVFAQEGLHVTVGGVPDQLRTVEERRMAGEVVEAGRALLAAEEELNRRKSMHRELMNIHYLIDAALGRAGERRLDTSDARKLLDESIRARGTDYAVALDKARESLNVLHGQLKGTENVPTGLWPFRRPPTTG